MGRLIDSERRARARQAKQERMLDIREEAIRSFVKLPYAEVTLDAIGQRAGVKKGVASMYFGSKEELFLLLLREQLAAWYDELEEGLRISPETLSGAETVRLVGGTLAARPLLARLLSLAAIVLEQNMEIIEAYRFQLWQRERMDRLGTELERRSRALAKGQGLRVLHLTQLAAGAFHPFAEPRGSLAVNLHDPDVADMKLDLERDLCRFVQGVLEEGGGRG